MQFYTLLKSTLLELNL